MACLSAATNIHSANYPCNIVQLHSTSFFPLPHGLLISLTSKDYWYTQNGTMAMLSPSTSHHPLVRLSPSNFVIVIEHVDLSVKAVIATFQKSKGKQINLATQCFQIVYKY
jgi:hypothetical protein